MNRICRRLGVLLTSCVLGVAFAQSSPVLQAGSVFSSSKHERSALPRVLPPSTPLSQNDETVGTLPGKLSVSSTGSANYTIPIDVPPGTAGMTPKLSLTYSSQNQNGMLGMGFALSGLTAITRTPSNLTQNGQIHGVDFTDADRFSLNGQQLVAVKGTYGQDQTEYRTYLDSQAKIVSYGRTGNGPLNFKVWTKGGQVAEYGGTEDASLKAEVKKPDGTLVDGETVKTWALNKIEDTEGNYLTVQYRKDEASGEQYPVEIDYTRNDRVGLQPYNKVQFIYEDRTDVRDLYRSGSLTKTQKRLKEIRVLTLIEEHYQLVYAYHIHYEYSPNSGRSRMTSIEECNGNGVCFKPTTFQWQTNEEGWEEEKTYEAPGLLSNTGRDAGARFVDLLGKGIPDLVRSAWWDPTEQWNNTWLNTGSGWVNTPNYAVPAVITNDNGGDTGSRFIDLNGNGVPDLIRSAWWSPTEQWNNAWLNTGSGWVEDPNYASPGVITNNNGGDTGSRFIDLNGNGRIDLIRSSWWNGTEQWNNAWLNTGEGWEEAPQYRAPAMIINGGRDTGSRFIDLNGNGLPDLIRSAWWNETEQWNNAWLNTGSGWEEAPNYASPGVITNNNGGDAGARFVDLTGDGLPDLVRSAWWGPTEQWNNAWINTGTGWKEESAYASPGVITNGGGKDAGARFVDFNGDGLPDLLRSAWWNETEQWNDAWVNTGKGWKEDAGYKLPCVITNGQGGDTGTRFIDLNGNGLPDVVRSAWFNPTEQWNSVWLNKAKKLPDYLIGVTDGLGEKTTIDYEPLSGTYVKVYRQEFKPDGTLDSQYPNPQFDSPMYVVYQTASDTALNDPQTKAEYQANGSNAQAKAFPQSPYSTVPKDTDGSSHLTTYHYSGARTNKLGVGFLGFQTMQTTDDTTGMTTTVRYSQDPAKHNVNQPETTITQQADGTILSQTDRTWDLKTFGDGAVNHTVYLPYTKQEVKQTNDLKGNLVSTVTTDTSLDNKANPLEVKVTTEDNTGKYEVDTKNIYKNDEAKWYIGELTDTTVTRSAPNTPSITRTSRFAYDPETGLLQATIVEPNDEALTVKTAYARNILGKITETSVSGPSIKSRTGRVTYDHEGRYAISETNALGQTSHQTMDPRFGKAISVTDANGLTIKNTYDGWGRLINRVHPDGTQQKNAYQWQTSSRPIVNGTAFKRRDAIDVWTGEIGNTCSRR